ncbi:MAG: hypothetical protein ABL907_17635 [Hyphomicrobium sp.]
MYPFRPLAAAAALGLMFGAGCVLSVQAAEKPSKAPSPACEDAMGLAVLSSPAVPWKGAPLRVVFTAEDMLQGELSLVAPDGSAAVTTRERHGGPPYFWYAEVAAPATGTWRAKLVRDGETGECATITRDIEIRRSPSPARASGGSVWPVRAAWNRETENLYSAWIEKLFDAPLDAQPSWPALHEVLRDPARNILFNHLSHGEDEKGLVIRPDCADLPYFLRAYFAFKMGLPFGYTKCSRGGGGKAPQCPAWWNIVKEEPAESDTDKTSGGGVLQGLFEEPKKRSAAKPLPRPAGLIPSFGYYLKTIVANAVHSGSARTAAADEATDYYPVPLTAEALRPGTVYADPYGHILVLVRRLPQSGDAAGVLLAVDGQPDGTVARKRFWRGNFLYAQDPALGGPGFKRFRPIAADKSGVLRRLSNAEIAKHPAYRDFSLDPSKLAVEAFYDAMDDVMSPAPLDPQRALIEAITALEEQVKTRVTSVENGRKYHTGGGGEVAMPDGASIFETSGPWEDFATPSRDLRLLIAIDVVRGFPERVARRPERYAMPKEQSVTEVKAGLERTLETELGARKFSYTRSDGSPWTLALKDIGERAPALEMAYNLNDCAELRWGASETSEEALTCKRRAPAAQKSKMGQVRAWFHDRRRPPRG